jgi:hypothetical protein
MKFKDALLYHESLLRESKMAEILIDDIDKKLNTYDIVGIKKVVLKVLAIEFPELAKEISSETHLDNSENIIMIAKTFCNFSE